MTRTLTIIVALLALCGVFTTAGAYAAPVAAHVTQLADDAAACAEPASEPVHLAGKFCTKRHSLGLPCAPMPLVIPSAVALGSADTTAEPSHGPLAGKPGPAWMRLYRPPRTALA